jgi:type I restriction enzyme R subunit
MAKKDYSEDLLIQAPRAEFLERELGWQSVLAYNDEDFGPDSLLGRQNDAEAVQTLKIVPRNHQFLGVNRVIARVAPNVSRLLQDLYDVVDTALTTDDQAVRVPSNQPAPRYDLSNIEFSRLRAEFEKTPFKNVVAMNLMEKIEERLAAMVARNPIRVDLYERYREIVQEYNKDEDAAEIQKAMDDLFAFNDDCSEEQKRYLREGLDNEDRLAVFDLLQRESLTKGDREVIKKVALELLDKLTSGKLQIDHWREKATAQAQVKAEIIKHLFANLPAGAYDADEINLKAGAVCAHIYTAGLSGGARVVH